MNEHNVSTDGSESEWLAQEAALHRERERRESGPDTPLIRRYRVVARTLLRPLATTLPSSFAWQAAELVRAAAGRWSAEERRFRRRLLTATTATLALLTAVLVALYGPDWIFPGGLRSTAAARLIALVSVALTIARLLDLRKTPP